MGRHVRALGLQLAIAASIVACGGRLGETAGNGGASAPGPPAKPSETLDASAPVDAALGAPPAADAGPLPDCRTDSDCPAPHRACARASCNAGTCGIAFTAAGMVVGDTAGDCHVDVCDGAGHVETIVDAKDAPPPVTPCETYQCDANGNLSMARAATGTPCGIGGACDGRGSCVTVSCTDGLKDGAETDVDCGGVGDCARCAPGRGCQADGDCTAGHFRDRSVGICM
jgi:hypothetical protein